MPEAGLPTPSPKSSEPGSSPAYPKFQRDDLRRHLRFRVDEVPAQLYVKGFFTSIGLGKVNKGRAAVNLSEGGVMIKTSEMIKVGIEVVVRIEIESHHDFVESPGVVRWCFQSARSNKDFYAGIRFTGLDSAAERKIATMRAWFTSPEYRAKTATRLRAAGPTIQTGE